MRGAVAEVIGNLCLFRESPGIRLIVKILEGGVESGSDTRPSMLELQFEVVAATSGFNVKLPQIGERFTVSSTIPPVYFGGMWSVTRLDAVTLEQAIQEAEADMGADRCKWVT